MKALITLLLSLTLIPAASGESFHPDFPLLNSAGDTVTTQGGPLSTMTTCGECHDTHYIAAHSNHADVGLNLPGKRPDRYISKAGPGYFGDADGLSNSASASDRENWFKRYGNRHVGGGLFTELIELDCLMCHSDLFNQTTRTQAIQAGDFSWANTSPLAQREILIRADGQWRWNSSKFKPDGTLKPGLLTIQNPTDEHCAQCHGQLGNDLSPPLTLARQPAALSMTEKSGQILSPQRISHSGLNIAGKRDLSRAFDIHSDRVVGCIDCHYSLNNPIHFRHRKAGVPEHLTSDPRRISIAEYLIHPRHQLANSGNNDGLSATIDSDRQHHCESCHNASKVHQWLPNKEQHLSALACEACHIPKLFGPAIQSLDWTMVDREGQPIKQHRGVDGPPAEMDSLIHGFEPVLLPRPDISGKKRLAPYNLITSWFWQAGDPATPVTLIQLKQAILSEGQYHPDIIAALDSDGSGTLTGEELQLDTPDKLNAVKQRLESLGLDNLTVAGKITPFAINHNIVNGSWAVSQCESCHSTDSRLAQTFRLSNYRPGGRETGTEENLSSELNGQIVAEKSGSIHFTPAINHKDFYIIGHNSTRWIDIAGLLMFVGTLLGVSGHGVARYLAYRRRPHTERSLNRVYMYDVYERLWHWLQAAAIMLLLFTGLVIHKPHLFSAFSFSYIVQVHNILGFILLLNAALALFYHLASGEIKQYLPKPQGFFGKSIEQARYYTKGIFEDAPHPFEKSRRQKLNPLQQVTYFGILNFLLPAQVVTGLLIWSIPFWPAPAAMVGGLPLLAPLHTLLAWVFASFIIMHVYLTTTAGPTPAAGIMAMVDGWDNLEVEPGTENEN